MEMDLETVGYLSGELSGFFAHVAKALAEKSSTGSLPPSLFSSASSAIVPVTAKLGRKSKKVKSTRAPRCASPARAVPRLKVNADTGSTLTAVLLVCAGLCRHTTSS